MELIKYSKAQFQKNMLILNDDVSIEEWKELGRALKQVEGSVQFWIGDWAAFGDKKGFTGKYTDSKVYDELEQITGLERQTIQDYKYVSQSIPSSLRNEDLSFTHHREVAKLPTVEKKIEFLTKASEEKLSTRELREEIRRDDIITNDVEFPKDKYRVIYADPPWLYGNSMPSTFTEQANHYSLMTIEEICDLPVKEITQDNAVLFLWATSPILAESFNVINAWGFEYKTSFVWDKQRPAMGHYNSISHEFLLVCTKGACTPDNLIKFDSVQSIKRTEHSKKPEEFRNIIDTIYPNGKRIELFARTKVNNWEVYGNQLLQAV